jgi:ADP-ribosyl-[dinitrogen reductase] hydrolase
MTGRGTRTSAADVRGCLIGGALGDAYGGVAERGRLCLSDDTQMTLATCETIADTGRVDPAAIAATFRAWFAARRFSGLGSATLKALRDLQAGAHWALAGARGEMAAGNGGAMRIAPLAFVLDGVSERQLIRDVVRITHHSDEAYVGALAVVTALQLTWPSSVGELLEATAESLPDSRVRDQVEAVRTSGVAQDVGEVARRFGSSGYVVETVPLALVAAWQVAERGWQPVLTELETAGGDTDTIASIAGQLAGARLGVERLPGEMLEALTERDELTITVESFATHLEARNRSDVSE